MHWQMTKTVIKQVCAQPRTSAVNMTLPAFVVERRAAGAVAAVRRRLLSNSSPPQLVDLNILPVRTEVHASWCSSGSYLAGTQQGRPNGPTNSAAITTMLPLRLCGGKLLVAVTREQRYGPTTR